MTGYHYQLAWDEVLIVTKTSVSDSARNSGEEVRHLELGVILNNHRKDATIKVTEHEQFSNLRL